MIIALSILLAVSLTVAVGAVALYLFERKWHESDNKAHSIIALEQKRAHRRIYRERNVWQREATRIMGMRMNIPAKPSEQSHQPRTSKLVSPSEAILRHKEAQDVPPPTTSVSTVPPAVANGFKRDISRNGRR